MTEEPPQKRMIVHYVPYFRASDGAVFEAITIKSKQMFLVLKGDKWSVTPEIKTDEDDKTIELLRPPEDFPYEPYAFTIAEIDSLPTVPGIEMMEKAYDSILETIGPYQDTQPWHKQIDAAGILLSHFQEKVETVPYIAKVGAPESGKTRSLGIISWLAYRPMMAVDLTSANVYRYYGRDVQAAGTLLHDEVDDGEIDRDKSLLAIYNSGYKYGARVPRIGGENNDKQSYYYSFGLKWFSGVGLPYSRTFRSRCIIQKFQQGWPERIDITNEDKELFRQVRKGLIVLRMLKAHDTFQQVNTGLRGRSRELYTPLLAVLEGTKHYATVLKQLTMLDAERQEEDKDSKQGYIARAVVGCWIEAAVKALEVKDYKELIADPRLVVKMDQPLFVPNSAVVAKLDVTESTNDKGRKILTSDEIPHTFSHYDIGKIQAENLNGKRAMEWIDKKKVRGYKYDLQTIRRLDIRYGTPGTFGTLGTPSGGTEGGLKVDKSRSEQVKNDPEKGVNLTGNSVPSDPSVPSIVDQIYPSAEKTVQRADSIKCPLCKATFETGKQAQDHGVRHHPGKAITARLMEMGVAVP